MLTDFTPYRFSDKTIRVNYNEIENKHWFVIEDVLCTIFANGKKYWAELKQEMIAAGMTSPTAFVTCECKEGKIDVANYKQMLHILSFVPNRKAKKARIAFWLQNHIEKDKKAENVTVVHYKEPKKESTKEKILNMLNSENSAIPAITGIILIHVPIVAYALMNKGIINSVVMLLIWVVSILGFIFIIIYPDEVKSFVTKRYYTARREERRKKETVKKDEDEEEFDFYKNSESHNYSTRIYTTKRESLTRCQYCGQLFLDDVEQCPLCGRMDIWPEIKNLTALALSDRVLTDLERQTIVNKAIKRGISSEEINQYLDDQLNLRLKSYTKVELRDCPFCGAQIPLISDDCMYCGQPLEHIEGETNAEFNISGYEAVIIRSENQRVEQERHGITNCPDCGAPFPLISNICSSCGHVLHERDENALNIKNLLENMQRSIDRVNKAPKPKAIQIIGYWFYYILLLFSVFGFIVGIIADNDAGKLISLIGFVFGVALMATNAVLFDTKSPVLIADGEYYKARHSYEMFARMVDTLYGDNKEAQDMLSKFSSTIKLLKKQRYKNRIRVGSIILSTAIAILGLITYLGTPAEKEEKPHPVINIKTNDYWALNFSKTLRPSNPENAVDIKLSEVMEVTEDAELTFVLATDSDNNYHWKVNKVALKGINANPWKHENILHKPISIVLLDSSLKKIFTMWGNVVSKHPYYSYNDVMSHNSNTYYADFWSTEQTSSDSILNIIAQRAEYYYIYSHAVKHYYYGR